MLVAMLQKKPFLLLKIGGVKTPLNELKDEEGVIIGDTLKRLLLCNNESDAAISEWIKEFPAMAELDSELKWFRSFMNTVSEHIFRSDIKLKIERTPRSFTRNMTLGE